MEQAGTQTPDQAATTTAATSSPRHGQHPRAFSPTALRTFDECRLRYRFAYLDKPEVEEEPSAHLVFGNALHKALAFLYRLPVEKRNEALAHKALRHFWSRIADRHLAFADDEDEAAWGHSALEALSRYCQSRPLDSSPLALEEWVYASLTGGLAIAGVVDRAERHPAIDGSLLVVDYKSGRCHFDSDDELAHDRGAQVYAVAASKALRRRVSEVRFIYLTEDRDVVWPVEAEDLVAAEERLAEAVGEILAAKDFSAAPNYWCRWCKYRGLCPAAGLRSSVDELDVRVEVPF